MNEHLDRVAAIVAAIPVGEERELRAYTYLNTTGTKTVNATHREALRRVGEHETAYVLTTQLGAKRAEETIRERYDLRSLADATLFDAHFRKLLSLPRPSNQEILERAIVRMRSGHRFVQAGADDGGGHSGRGISGGSTALFAEGDHFALEIVEFEGPYGQTPKETLRERTLLLEPELADRLASDSSLRALVGMA